MKNQQTVVEISESFFEKQSFSYDPLIRDSDSSAYWELFRMSVYGPKNFNEIEEEGLY